VEVTEHALMEPGTRFVVRALNHLKAAGIRIALDDFGTGYSSLSHLRDYPVDVLKIDKSFVQSMVENSEIAAIVAAVVNLSQGLCIETVAEGVETKLQAEMLRGFGCDLRRAICSAGRSNATPSQPRWARRRSLGTRS
jgi:EAL domain-containing protein (putative c-di-GMP-specific phosphodiesterase class I)